jgi:hypothetical protein
MTHRFGKIPRTRTLAEIVQGVEASRAALNPFALVGERIISQLNRQFIFPFLQPNIVNKLEFNEGTEMYLRNKKTGLFERPHFRGEMGMDAPVGNYMCIGEDEIPFFVTLDQMSSQIASKDYYVHDDDSFRRFLPALIKDMSFLRPILKSQVEAMHQDQNVKDLQVGDIVLIPNQRYAKLGVVREVTQKEYLAQFFSPECFLSPRIGVNTDELALKPNWMHPDDELHQQLENRLSWINKEARLKSGRRLPIGAGLCYVKKHEGDKEDRNLGYVSISGFDQKCAIVAPHHFDDTEYRPWGGLTAQSIPVSDLVRLGSIEDIKAGVDLYAQFFATDIEVTECVRDATVEMDNPHVKGLMAFCDLTRYQRLHDDLVLCPQVPPNIVASQFVHILTQNGTDGIERLAKVSNRDVNEVARDLLAKDIEQTNRYVGREVKQYAPFVTKLQELVKKTTPFESVEKLLEYAGPQIHLYQMPRDGTYTLAFIESLEFLSKFYTEQEEEGRWNRRVLRPEQKAIHRDQFGIQIEYQRFVDSVLHDFREMLGKATTVRRTGWFGDKETDSVSSLHAHLGCEFLTREEMEKYEVIVAKGMDTQILLAGNYHILRKRQTIRFGRDENFNMTYPGLEPISSQFTLHPITREFQLDFLVKVFQRISEKVEFEGQNDFFNGLQALVEEVTPKQDNDEDRYLYRDDSRYEYSHTLDTIRPFYNGVRQLTDNPEVKDQIVQAVLSDKPVLLEAFYDFENMQRMIMVRDHYWRGNESGKLKYLRRFGYTSGIGRFADDFYAALSSVDMYHRGFPHSEDSLHGITRAHSSSFRFGDREQSHLGQIASPQATAMLEGIRTQAKLLSDSIRRGKVAGFLTAPEDNT